jgi:hypothetical protein
MSNSTSWTAIRTDRGLTAAHRGAASACATKPNGGAPMTFAVPAYVTDQESHPPREWCV